MNGRIRLPMGPPVQREFYDVPVGSVESMLAKANEYAASHANQFEEILDVYRQVADKAAGTPQEREVMKRVNEISTQRDEVLAREMTTREAKTREFVQQGKYREAFNAWADFPAGLRSFETDQKIMAILEESLPADWRP
jgi:hypothetical protein